MYVLHHADKPSIYAGLPDNPRISPVVEGWKGPAKAAGLAVAGIAAAGALLHGIFGRPNRVSDHEEEEAQDLVDDAGHEPDGKEA